MADCSPEILTNQISQFHHPAETTHTHPDYLRSGIDLATDFKVTAKCPAPHPDQMILVGGNGIDNGKKVILNLQDNLMNLIKILEKE